MKFARRKPLATRRSSTSWIRKTTRFAIYARDGFDCLLCFGMFPPAYDGRGLTLDHIVPRAAGGTDRPENLATACHDCNSRRQNAVLPAGELERLLGLAARPLNRELGKHYAFLYLQCRNTELLHPLTLRAIPKVLYHPHLETDDMVFDDVEYEYAEEPGEAGEAAE